MRSKRGSILILVLFTLSVLSMVGLSFAYRAGLETRAARRAAVMATLKAQADSAAWIAIARLAENTAGFTHPAQSWHTHDPLAKEKWLAEWMPAADGGLPLFAAYYSVIDEEGKLNLTSTSGADWTKLGMNSIQIDSLNDWTDGDDIAQPQGAENDYYASRPHPYFSKNAQLDLLDELLLIKGFSLTDYLGGEMQTGSNNAASNPTLANMPMENRLRLGWVDLLTCCGDGKINLNTAPVAVLQTLPISDGAVQQIATYREYGPSSGDKLEDHAFRSDDDIKQLQGLKQSDRNALIGKAIYQSKDFRILAWAVHNPTGLQCRLQVLVQIGSKPAIEQWTMLP